MIRNPLRLGIAAILIATATTSSLQAQTGNSRVFGDLLRRAPEHANMLMLINVDGLFDSAIGKRENWREQAKESRKNGFGFDSSVSKVVIAGGLEFPSMNERWKVGMAQVKSGPVDLESLAAREGGYVETIGKVQLAWTPRGFDLFVFPEKIVGFVWPTDRQGIVRWTESAFIHPRDFPPGFADRAIYRTDLGAQIAIAFNLSNALSAKMVEPWIKVIDGVKKNHVDPVSLAPRLATAKSAFLVIKADQFIEGTIRIDFEENIVDARPVAREMILTAIEEIGAQLPEVKTWSLEFDKTGKAIEMSGRISEDSVRKVVSLAQPPKLSPAPYRRPPVISSSEPAAAKPAPRSSSQDGLNASQAYFRSVTTMIEGLKKIDRPTYRSYKLWYDKYAKQIDELPILNVDKDLLDWGATVSRTMREMSSGINYYSQNQTYTLASDSAGTYAGYGYGYGDGGSRTLDASVIKKKSDAMMSVDLDKKWQAVEISVADMRRKMTEKYQIEF